MNKYFKSSQCLEFMFWGAVVTATNAYIVSNIKSPSKEGDKKEPNPLWDAYDHLGPGAAIGGASYCLVQITDYLISFIGETGG